MNLCNCERDSLDLARLGSLALNGSARADIRILQEHVLVISALKAYGLMNESIITT
jgi:hypothetical protein